MIISSLKQINRDRVLVDSFWFYSDALVLAQQIEKDIYWLLNNFITIQADKTGWAGFWIYGMDCMAIVSGCPFFDFQRINKALCTDQRGKTIIDFVKEQIDNGATPIIMVDRFYLKSYAFTSKNSNHELMIYGYDEDEKRLLYCDHDKNGLYRVDMSCSYKEFQEAYMNFDKSLDWPDYEFNNNLCVIKPLPTKEYKLDVNSIRTAIQLYINPPAVSYLDCIRPGSVRDRYVYENFCEYYSQMAKGDLPFTGRVQEMHLLYDHKKVMNYRIQYFINEKIAESNPIFAQYSLVENMLLAARNLIIKHIISGSNKHLMSCIDKMKEAEELEAKILHIFTNSF